MKFNNFPFARYLIFFISGIFVYIQTGFFHTSFYFLLPIFLVLVLIFLKFNLPIIRGIFLWLFFFFLGWSVSYFKTETNYENHFSNQSQFSHYQAIIISNTEVKPKTYKVEAGIKAIKIQDSTWQNSSGKVLLYFDKSEAEKPKYGDIFVIKGMPREVESPKNPFEFDYRKYMNYKGIVAHHFLWGNSFVKVGNEPQSKILSLAYRANHYADSIFKATLQTKNEYAVASAMVMGLRDEIDNDLLDAYSATGAVHVLSVSGMHVGILFLVLRWVFGRLKKKRKRGKFAFMTLVISVLWIYAIFAGLSATVLRATVMFSFIQLGSALDLRQNIYNTLAISALLLLAWNPYWVLDVGFQLSYLAIIGIVFLHPYLNQIYNPTNPILRELWSITVVCFSAQLFTFPLSVYYFHQFPTYFLLANPFVAFFSFLVLPAGLVLIFISAIPYLFEIPLFFLKWSLIPLNKIIFTFEKLPLATLKGFSISLPEMLLIYAFIYLFIKFFLESEIKFLKMSFMVLLILASWNIYEDFEQSKQKQLTIHFIPKKTGISILDGKSATFIADSSLLNSPKIYNFHLKNYFDNQGINHKNLVDVADYANKNGMTYIDFEGKRILWMREKFRGKIKGSADFVILSNDAVRKLHPAFSEFQTNQFIVDDSNKKYVVENLKHQADSLKISLISLYENGAFVVK